MGNFWYFNRTQSSYLQHECTQTKSLSFNIIPFLLFSFLFHSTELTLSESDDPPNTAERIATINNQHYQFHSDYDNENSFTSDIEHDDISLQNALNRGPYFDLTASKNVTALVGNTAYLNCRVRNLGNKTVTIRFKLSFHNPLFPSWSSLTFPENVNKLFENLKIPSIIDI